MNDDILAAVRTIRAERYPDADTVFAAGSLVRGEGTAFSDLDLVVLYPTIRTAYRESFRFGRYPVEAFVHDPETLEYFFTEIDRPAGIAALPHMVAEGVEVPGPTPTSQQLKVRAAEVLALGPPPLSLDDEQRLRYAVTDILDDLRGVRTPAETVATGAQLFEALANYYFRSHGYWSARGKAIPIYLARRDLDLARRYMTGFQQLFGTGDVRPVVALTEGILREHGGVLFEGYRSEAPQSWRAPKPPAV